MKKYLLIYTKDIHCELGGGLFNEFFETKDEVLKRAIELTECWEGTKEPFTILHLLRISKELKIVPVEYAIKYEIEKE